MLLALVCHADPDGKVWDMGGKNIVGYSGEPFDIDGMNVQAVSRPSSTWEKLTNKIFQSDYFKTSVEKVVELNPEVIHCHEPAALYIAFQAKEMMPLCKIIFDSHESWQGGTAKEELVKKMYLSKLRYLIAANPITAGNLLTANRELKTEVIYNYAHPDYYPQHLDWNKLNKPIIVHDGYMFFDRGLKDIVEAIVILKKEFPNVKLRILGETKDEEKTYLDEMKKQKDLAENIEETGWVDFDKVGEHLADCSIGLITKTPTPNNILGGPSIKLFNYFAYGIAIVDVGLPMSTHFLNKTRSGVSIKERSAANLASALKRLLNSPDLLKRYCENSAAAYAEHNWLKEESKLIAFYKNEVLNESDFVYR